MYWKIQSKFYLIFITCFKYVVWTNVAKYIFFSVEIFYFFVFHENFPLYSKSRLFVEQRRRGQQQNRFSEYLWPPTLEFFIVNLISTTTSSNTADYMYNFFSRNSIFIHSLNNEYGKSREITSKAVLLQTIDWQTLHVQTTSP